MKDLVERLTREQAVEASLRPEDTVEALKAAVDRGYVHVRFVETRGGTELGVRLDPTGSDLSEADFAAGRGRLQVVGRLVLDDVPVRCHATIDLETRKGTGHLEILEDVAGGAPSAEAS